VVQDGRALVRNILSSTDNSVVNIVKLTYTGNLIWISLGQQLLPFGVKKMRALTVSCLKAVKLLVFGSRGQLGQCLTE
jgi:hypothetical protein